MRRFRMVSLLAIVLALAVPAFAQDANKWEIDRAHSSAQFAVRHMGVSTVRGSFTGLEGAVTIDDKNLANSVIEVTIDATTVNTANQKRDDHLRSADFFDVANHPTMTFKSKKVESAGASRLKVTGDLTVNGVTKEVVLEVEGPTPSVNAGRGLKRGASATTRLNRRDFGLLWGALVEGTAIVGDEIQVTIDLELNQQRPAAAGATQ